MIKRALDILGAAIGLIVFSPILIVISVMIKREMGSPVLFQQTRPGREGKPFQMIKFRTMRDAIDADGRQL
ncbi:sugar transferase, partial [Shimia litoralis]